MIYKNIYYTISHLFVLLFIYLFISRRFSRFKTAVICVAMFFAITVPTVLKLNIFPESRLCYALVTIYQILMTQFTGLFISKHRDSKALFLGLSASNYVLAGSIMASILHICTGNLFLCIAGCVTTHIIILYVLYVKIHDICLQYQEENRRNWWKLCLIPVFFYCGFSSFVFFPFNLDDHPENILGVAFFLITMFVSYVIVMRYVAAESSWTKLYWRNLISEAHIKNMETQYHLVQQSEKNLRILRHDMRHYSGMIDSLLEQGEYQEIKKITQHINSVSDGNKVTKYCDNLIVNTMFSYIVDHAVSLDIAVRREIVVEAQIPVNEYEFSMVVANLLENAVNCVKEFSHLQKIVNVKIHCTTAHLLIHVKNEYELEPSLDERTGLPKNSKGKNHGFGLQSVQAFSDKIGGNLGCYCESGSFHIVLFAKF